MTRPLRIVHSAGNGAPESEMNHPLRILYSAGPGDVIHTYCHWVKGEDDPTQLAMTYSGMFYETCQEHGDSAYVISTCVRKDAVDDGRFLIIHRPALFAAGPGPMFYVGQLWNDFRLIASALWFKADVAVIGCGDTSWGPLRILPLLGITVVPSLHCTLWSKYRRLTMLQRFFKRMRVPFFKKTAFRILSISSDVSEQLEEMTSGRHRPIIAFTPSYRRRKFDGIAPPSDSRPRRVLFAGRIDRNKGVFDLLAIAKRFAAEGRTDVAFDVCGSGPAIDELKQKITEASLDNLVSCHGHCNWERMRQMYEQCHIVIVPTTGDFVEGFNKVLAEAVLAGRPAITSEVCPALAYVEEAVVQVPVDDVRAYGDAILKLCDDQQYYDAKRAACIGTREQFYDMDRSWMAALRTVLDDVRALRKLDGESEPVGAVN